MLIVCNVNTATKGNASEAAILNAFVERGFCVLVPFGDGHPFDLVVHLGAGDFLRVQCKTARLVDGCVGFNSRSTDHGRGPGRYDGLADVFGIYFPPLASIYVLPVAEISGLAVQLRLKPALNNQRKRVRMAADYLIERWTAESLRAICRAESPAARERALRVA
jgi:PD-(D/E)XK endonuclease